MAVTAQSIAHGLYAKPTWGWAWERVIDPGPNPGLFPRFPLEGGEKGSLFGDLSGSAMVPSDPQLPGFGSEIIFFSYSDLDPAESFFEPTGSGPTRLLYVMLRAPSW
jgi:hypothetical protein